MLTARLPAYRRRLPRPAAARQRRPNSAGATSSASSAGCGTYLGHERSLPHRVEVVAPPPESGADRVTASAAPLTPHGELVPAQPAVSYQARPPRPLLESRQSRGL